MEARTIDGYGEEQQRLSRGELLLILAFWTFMAVLTSANGLLDPRARAMEPVIQGAPIALAFIVSYLWAALTPGIFWLADRFPLDRGNVHWFARVLMIAAAGVCIAVAMDAIGAWLRFGVFFQGIRRPPPPFGPLITVTRFFFIDDLIIFIAVLAAGIARAYSLRLRARRAETVRLQAQAANLQAQLAEARLSALRSQIDPHFLFNTLNAVSSLVERDPRGVRRMIARLSELLRHRLEGVNEQETTVEQELDSLSRYLEIMQIRFQGKLEVKTEVDADARDALVPTLVLQPLVENALKHGVGATDETGRIEIGGRVEDDRVVLSVRDNGPGLREDGTTGGNGVGLRNTRDRLHQLYGSEQSLELRDLSVGTGSPNGVHGVIAIVSLPYHTRGDLRVNAVHASE